MCVIYHLYRLIYHIYIYIYLSCIYIHCNLVHNTAGEKGIWNKWTLFEHSTRVPLIIVDPQATYAGHHFRPPVELVDVVPTVLDLLGVDKEEGKEEEGRGKNRGVSKCVTRQQLEQEQQEQGGATSFTADADTTAAEAVTSRPLCRHLDGKSLAALFLHPRPPAPPSWQQSWQDMRQWLAALWSDPQEEAIRLGFLRPPPKFIPLAIEQEMKRTFALSQKQLCAHKKELHSYKLHMRLQRMQRTGRSRSRSLSNPWRGCAEFTNSDKHNEESQVSKEAHVSSSHCIISYHAHVCICIFICSSVFMCMYYLLYMYSLTY